MEIEGYHKRYYQTHKELYKTKYVKKVTCECCHKEMVDHNYNKHQLTQKFKNNMRNKIHNVEDCDKMIQTLIIIKNKLNEKNI